MRIKGFWPLAAILVSLATSGVPCFGSQRDKPPADSESPRRQDKAAMSKGSRETGRDASGARAAGAAAERQIGSEVAREIGPAGEVPAGEVVVDRDGKVRKPEAAWRQILSPEEFYVLRQKGTERPYVNKYDKHFEPGSYACAACGYVLFESDTKFDSGCGWPAFYAAKAGDRVAFHRDFSHGMTRVEVTCARCDSHLGHIFNDAPLTPTGHRYCINSVSIKFIPFEGENPEEEAGRGRAAEGEVHLAEEGSPSVEPAPNAREPRSRRGRSRSSD
jgi:peptide-methionine (R)-S-oxide reductase